MPYSAYSRREIPAEDAELTHVGPGTPCGEYLRRFWHPVGLSAELRDLPLRIKILCEDLVLFRDRSGRPGLLQLHCPHRGTSLEFGRISERGITCCYHGWHFDVDGRILDTPGEPADSTLKHRLWHGAYPTQEFKGLVFAYMGPPDKKPPFPLLDTFNMPGYRTEAGSRTFLPCNWLQNRENTMDPVHTVYLHTAVSGVQFTNAFGDKGALDWMETPVGMVYIHTRRVGDNVWMRMNDFIPPNMHQVPRTWEDGDEEFIFKRPMMTQWSVPIDDTHTMNMVLRHVNERLSEKERARIKAHGNAGAGDGFGQTGDRPYEERQRFPGDYDAQVGQRPIAIHALEHLATTDRGIVMVRRMLREGIRAVARGEDPPTLNREAGKTLLTYSNHTVLRLPRRASEEEDNRLLLETGRRMAEGFLQNHPAGMVAGTA